MRPRIQRALLRVGLFLAALLIVIYLTSPSPSTGESHDWSKVLYETTASILPEARGMCPGLETNTKPALVVSRVSSDGDISWLDALAEKYFTCIYTADAPLNTHSYLQVPANRGHEAMGYLTFIIDNYASIPASGAVFIHGSRWAWHNDHPEYDNAILLNALDISSALEHHGYHNLRCDWSLSSCPASYAPQGSLSNFVSARLEPWDKRAVSDAALPRAFAQIFGENGAVRRDETIRSQCCGQFVVSRESLWRHEREEYVALRQWLLDGTGDSSAAPVDDKVAGRILSYLWHILFLHSEGEGEEAGYDLARLNELACPSAQKCYCTLYGRCGLEPCSDESCVGQYRLPPNLKVEGQT